MQLKKLIIYGVGRYAEYVRYVFDNDSEYKVIGYCIERSFTKDKNFDNLPLYSFDDININFSPESVALFIAVGSNEVRKRIFEKSVEKGFFLPNYISTKAIRWENLEIGMNCFIGEGSTIQPFVEIGNNCIFFIVNIGHHCRIGNHVLVSAMTLGGNVEIGNNCYLGMNSTVAQNTMVAENTIIGMGCTISKHTTSGSVYAAKGTSKRNISFDEVSSFFLK